MRQCRKHSPVFANSTQHSRANAPPSRCRQCCLDDLWIQRVSDSLLHIACAGERGSCIMSNQQTSRSFLPFTAGSARASTQPVTSPSKSKRLSGPAGGFRMTATFVEPARNRLLGTSSVQGRFCRQAIGDIPFKRSCCCDKLWEFISEVWIAATGKAA